MSTEHPSGAPGFWSLRRVADALRSQAVGRAPSDDRPIARVWTDTRSVRRGDLFVALKGGTFDAHDYLKEAVAGGAIGVVVSRPVANLGVPVIEVDDTLAALGAVGQYRRRAWSGPVVGVGGSNGKTSTKELIGAALGTRLEVHATMGNLNNLVGVPLTLLAIPDDADVAVVEMGTNQPGEVATLRAIIEPTLAVLTSIGEEHLEGLGDMAGGLRAELCVAGGVAVLVAPAAQPEIGRGARGRALRVIEAGLETGDLKATDWTVLPDGTGRVTVNGVSVAVPLRGAHNLRNAMLALAVARELGIPIDAAARGIAALTPPPMRVSLEQIGRATLINDAYNANPPSMRAAIDLLVHAGAGRQRVAILGTMRELGGSAGRLHDDLARAALASPVELVGGVGEMGHALASLAAGDPRVATGDDPAEVWRSLASRVAPDAVILLKGSRGVRLERLAPGRPRCG